jgi:tetratricopeptide (TPR) repeat protein/predicted Ser/Thr protein kinase
VQSSGDTGDESVAREALARGVQVGRFVVLGLVGRGGMGDVYAAHDPELDRKVAIKLLRGRANHGPAGEGRARLMREAQAIAKVSHPNVVVIYDVGTFDGRVFIAMEFIEGNTLGYWMQFQQRNLAEILEVFVAAGRGLESAHEKELVHRDFKPDNVMVGTDGQVRVMDFGLARLAIDRDKSPSEVTGESPLLRMTELDVDPMSTRILSQATPNWPLGTTTPWQEITRAGAIVGTPAYMAPEQFQGAATDARTDQFSFCIALYEALYAVRPFAAQSLQELTTNVLTGQIRPEPEGSSVPASIRRALLRGLSTSPEDRFPSMNALLAELQQEPAWSGVHRFTMGAAAKLAGIWEAPEGDEGEPETEAKAGVRRAFLATGKPYAAAAFEATSRILDRFTRRWTDLYVDACEATHVRGDQSPEILDLRMVALGDALEDLRALCHQLRQATSDTVENAVNAATALGTLERCADVKLLRAIVRPPEDPATRAEVEELRVRLAGVRALARLGRVSEGLKKAVALESDARRVGYAPLLAEVLFICGMMRFEVSDVDEATRTVEDAAWTAELCRHDEVAAEAAASLVYMTGHVQSRFDAGEIWSRHAETVLRRIGGHDLIRGWLFNNRGAMRATQGRLREAIEDMHQAVGAKEKALGPDDADVGSSVGNTAIYLDELGETEQAVEFTERAVRIMEGALGQDHPKVAIQLANLAELRNRLGRFEEARIPAERALAIFERETDPDGIYVTYPLAALGLSHLGAGRFREAVPPLARAVRIRDAREKVLAKLGEVHFALARALGGAGEDLATARALALRARNEYREAPATPATARELDQLDRWLASLPGPAPLTEPRSAEPAARSPNR